MIQALRSFYAFLDRYDLLVDRNGEPVRDPLRRIEAPKISRRATDWLRAADDARFMAAAETPEERIIAGTGAGVITSQNGCEFGQATTFLKSRSSSSFPAEVKDFIAPVSTPIFTNCGALLIKKNSAKTGNAVLTSGAAFCFSTTSGCTSTTTGATQVSDGGTTDEDSTTGEICVSGLAPGAYYVNETTAPSGYAKDTATNVQATVANGTNCGTSKPSSANTATFSDKPLSDIQVNFKDDGSGETNGSGTTISCDNGTNGTTSTTATSGWDKSVTVTNVQTGSTDTVIHCTITIDP